MAAHGLKYLPMYFTFCAGVVSHLLLFICLIKDPLKCFRNFATYLIMNLGFADFIVCTVGLMRMIFGVKYRTVVYILDAAMLVSLFSILSIAIDRYILTAHPFKHRVFLNGRRMAIWIVSVWLLSFYPLVKILTYGADQTLDRLIYATIVMIFASVTFGIYILTYFTLKRREREISQQQSQSQNRVLQKSFLKTIMIVAFVQILTLLPISIQDFVDGHASSPLSSIVGFITFEMFCLNFAMNPLLYTLRLKNYRETFRLVFCNCKLC